MPFKTKSFAVTACFLVQVASSSVFAQSKCPEFPEVDFWGTLTHDMARQRVAQNFSGNWSDNIEQLKRQHATLSRINGRGKAARVSRAGRKVVLKGASLTQYLSFSQQRIEVTECLASEGQAPVIQASTSPSKLSATEEESEKRTYLTLPLELLKKLREEAVRRSKEENRKVGVNEVILDTVRKELKQENR
ncbi:MAG: hypothetical protein HQ494_15975 [Rhodospirillales bacterium]|nr:hypothetical protein [Rhodospirillales bacterium]